MWKFETLKKEFPELKTILERVLGLEKGSVPWKEDIEIVDIKVQRLDPDFLGSSLIRLSGPSDDQEYLLFTVRSSLFLRRPEIEYVVGTEGVKEVSLPYDYDVRGLQGEGEPIFSQLIRYGRLRGVRRLVLVERRRQGGKVTRKINITILKPPRSVSLKLYIADYTEKSRVDFLSQIGIENE